MARTKLTPLLAHLRGAVGGIVFKQYGDRLVVTRKPAPSSKPPSAKQLAHQQRFAEASRYGKRVSDTPELRVPYAPRAKAEGKAVYTLAVGDAMNPPVVEALDLAAYGPQGGTVSVEATDDFEVVRVGVALIGTGGAVLAEGEAQRDGERWSFAASVPRGEGVTVRVRAYDRPGNVGERTAPLPAA